VKFIECETHCHTKESSICAHTAAAPLIREYGKLGYKMVIITDHYYKSLWESEAMRGKSWEECIDIYLAGYRNAKKTGEKVGVNVLMGMEIQLDGCDPYDFLVYGMDESFLKEHPYLNRMSMPDFYSFIHEKGFLMFQAHPYRYGKTPITPITYDGIEVYNAHIEHVSRNNLAVHFALEHDLLMIAGSDCHIAGGSARGGVMMPEEVDSIEAFVEYYKKNGSPELIITLG